LCILHIDPAEMLVIAARTVPTTRATTIGLGLDA
jgi:hypothetical protein